MKKIQAEGISQIKLIDATPIGINIRSTVATYANIHDELRKIYARAPLAKDKGFKVEEAFRILRKKKGSSGAGDGISLPALMELSVDEAIEECSDLPLVRSRLQVLHDIGLGYLTLGEETPGLSGGEAQRLKLASEMGWGQGDTIFVFDEPTIGLHPLDVITLLSVFRHLIENGATVIVIEHDLDVIRSCKESLTGRYI